MELRPLNVLIGANGAGKSNLISFFKLMNELMAERLQQHVASTGHATTNLHFGPRVTPQLAAELRFETDTGDVDTYTMRLFHAAGDSLIFAQESLSFLMPGYMEPRVEELGPGHKETLIGRAAREGNPTASPPGSVDRMPKAWRSGWRTTPSERSMNGGEEHHRRQSALMARLYLFAEGRTEQTFADTVLKPHLAECGVYMNRPVLIAHAHRKHRTHRGGGRKFRPMQNDICRFLKQDSARDVFFTSMIDLYVLHSGFPGVEVAEEHR